MAAKITTLGDVLYEQIKSNVQYNADIHCPLIIDMFSNNEGISEFCLKIGISRQRFTAWQTCPMFREAVMLGKEVGKIAWMKIRTEWEPEDEDDKFDVMSWQQLYKKNFGSGNTVSLFVNPKDTPIQQYEQIMIQAAAGDFTSAQIKQIMESINIGLRALEVCNLQDEINELKQGLKKMEERELEYQITTSPTTQENKAPLAS
jgi:hypothetical protein